MKEQLIDFDTAKLAKERGFMINTYTGFVFDKNGEILNLAFYNMDNKYARPTQSLLQKWLREECDIHIEVRRDWNKDVVLGFEYLIDENDGSTQGLTYKSYEEALEKGLQESLKLI